MKLDVLVTNQTHNNKQPPSGGCVLKPDVFRPVDFLDTAAAFGRLCVETVTTLLIADSAVAAAFGRLCVETPPGLPPGLPPGCSRLRAAVC